MGEWKSSRDSVNPESANVLREHMGEWKLMSEGARSNRIYGGMEDGKSVGYWRYS